MTKTHITKMLLCLSEEILENSEKIFSQRVLVKLQTDIVSPESLCNIYDELLMSRIFFFS